MSTPFALIALTLALFLPWKTTSNTSQNLAQHISEPQTNSKPSDTTGNESYWDKTLKPDVLPVWIGGVSAFLASIAGLIALSFLRQQTKAGIVAAEAANSPPKPRQIVRILLPKRR